MLNQMRTGMGAWTLDPNFDPLNLNADPWVWDNAGSTPPYNPPSQSNKGNYLTMLGLGLEKTFSNIFAPVGTSVAQAQGSLVPQFNQQQLLAAQQQALRVSGNTSTAGINASGVNLFGSQIGWVPILIVAGILFFPGFSRRK